MSLHRIHCRLGGHGPPGAGQITVGEHMTPFQRATGKMKLWRIFRGIDTEMFKKSLYIHVNLLMLFCK